MPRHKRAINLAVVATLMAASLVLVGPVAAAGTTVYVDDDVTCDGNAPCYETIQAGIDAATAGDTVFVHSGTYGEHVAISKSLVLEGENRELVIVDGGGSGNVIYVTASGVTIRGLTVTNGSTGIHFAGGSYTVKDCVLSGNGENGLYAAYSSSSVIENCEIFDNGNGIVLRWAQNALVTGNLVHDNVSASIWFDSMGNSVVENNRVWRNGVGITLGFAGQFNTVRDNAICANNVYGLYANWINVNNNRAYHNDLEANTPQAYDLGSNWWDNGYPSGGNYWADYTGVDTNFDGIGDTPYSFHDAQDDYPLMEPTIFAAPQVTAFTAPPAPVQVNTAIQVSATFADPDSYITHTGEWDWGDDTTSPALVDETAQTVTGTHTYTVPGVYTVSLTLDDLCGPPGAATYKYVAIYDPDGGFATGGGWIYSDPGAYVPDPSLEGKATFGFVSKYKKGATVPTGNTEFQFHAGDLNFHSSSYDWLVVTGSNFAKFKGVGTISGEGEYKFQIWAGDDTPDTFRIKIWYEDGGEVVVYDNTMNQPIGAGSIIIHTKKK